MKFCRLGSAKEYNDFLVCILSEEGVEEQESEIFWTVIYIAEIDQEKFRRKAKQSSLELTISQRYDRKIRTMSNRTVPWLLDCLPQRQDIAHGELEPPLPQLRGSLKL